MKRWIPWLAGLLCVQVALAFALNLKADALVPQRIDAKLVDADLKTIDRLTIDGPIAPADGASAPAADKVELVKRDGRWRMPGDFDAPADGAKVQGLIDRVAALQRGLPIATTAAALDRFQVDAHRYERRLVASAGGKPVATVYLGAAAGPRRSDARTDKDAAVYAVDLSAYDLPVAGNDWLDNGLLAPDAKSLAQIEVAAAGKPALTLVRAPAAAASAAEPAAWKVKDVPAGDKPDDRRAAALAGAIAGLKVDSVLGDHPVPDWQQDRPELTLTLKDAQGKAVTWTLSKRRSGDTHVLKASDRPWYAELQPYHAQPLLDAAAPDRLVVSAAAAAASAPSAAASAARTLAANPIRSPH